jgi:DNA primase
MLDARAVKSRADIVAVAGRYTRLRRAGRQYVGLCPLHAERHPSFYVHPEKQVFHCFGCGAGGDVFSLVMALRGCDFVEALAEVARLNSGLVGEASERPAVFAGRERAGGEAPRPAKQAPADSRKPRPPRREAPRAVNALRGGHLADLDYAALLPCEAEALLLVNKRITDRE